MLKLFASLIFCHDDTTEAIHLVTFKLQSLGILFAALAPVNRVLVGYMYIQTDIFDRATFSNPFKKC